MTIVTYYLNYIFNNIYCQNFYQPFIGVGEIKHALLIEVHWFVSLTVLDERQRQRPVFDSLL